MITDICGHLYIRVSECLRPSVYRRSLIDSIDKDR